MEKTRMINWKALKNILSAAFLAGFLVGLLLTAMQKAQVSPIILEAEVYEEAVIAAQHSASVGEHVHEHSEWEPENGVERTAYTAAANISMAVGFGLLIGAGMCLSGGVGGWRSGLLWGLAGYTVFFVAPSLGLHPEVPGTESAPLVNRQLWWVATAATTAGGLALLAFFRSWKMRLAAVALLILPHFIGAPHPAVNHSAAPETLAHAFIYATAWTNALFWLALGGMMGWAYEKPIEVEPI